MCLKYLKVLLNYGASTFSASLKARLEIGLMYAEKYADEVKKLFHPIFMMSLGVVY